MMTTQKSGQDSGQDSGQTTQRIKVGMIGLAAVLLLIGLAAAIFSTASRERAVSGGARADIVANLTISNDTAAVPDGSEPLADLGVTPSTATETVNVAAISANTQAGR